LLCFARWRTALTLIDKARGMLEAVCDLDLLVALCRWCHDQTDAPYERGRLVVTALGAGEFTFEVVRRVAGGTSPARVLTFLPTWAK